MKFLTGFQIKLLVLSFMILDHLVVFFPGTFPIELRYIGRIVAPLFFFIATESFFYTSSKKRYLKRLYIAALIMAIGNILVMYITILAFKIDEVSMLNNNIFLSIAVCITVLYCIDWAKKQNNPRAKMLVILLAVLFSLISLWTEYGYIALFTILIFYFLKENNRIKYIAYTAFSFTVMIVMGGFQWLMVLALPFIYLYNGKRGAGFKYLFYIFYPLSLWIPYFLKYSPWF